MDKNADMFEQNKRAFYRRPSITAKHIFFVDRQTPLSSFSMLKYALWTLSRCYNTEKGRGVEM